MLLERIFAHFKALCCILSASILLCLGVHLLCIHDAPFLDQCLMCILLHSCILYSMTFLRILTHSERLLRILGCMGGCSGEAPRHARPGMTAGIYFFSAEHSVRILVHLPCTFCAFLCSLDHLLLFAFCTHFRAFLAHSLRISPHFRRADRRRRGGGGGGGGNGGAQGGGGSPEKRPGQAAGLPGLRV